MLYEVMTDPAKSFNRGATDYFRHGRKPDITAFDSPESAGEPVGEGLLIKYKDFAVMKSNWRLVGSELYDLKTDPGLKSNVATKHQELVQQLKTDYESWWTAISEKANGNTPFVINPDKQKEVVISS